MANFKTSFEVKEGITIDRDDNSIQYYNPFIWLNPQEGQPDYDGATIRLRFAENTPLDLLGEIANLLDSNVLHVEIDHTERH